MVSDAGAPPAEPAAAEDMPSPEEAAPDVEVVEIDISEDAAAPEAPADDDATAEFTTVLAPKPAAPAVVVVEASRSA